MQELKVQDLIIPFFNLPTNHQLDFLRAMPFENAKELIFEYNRRFKYFKNKDQFRVSKLSGKIEVKP
jgi:hypothetical protein